MRNIRIVIVGAGMAGMLAAIKFGKLGYSNVKIIEKAAAPGGTWRENKYPGLFCDVPAHSYTYSFEPNPNWSRYLAPGYEIQQYFESTFSKYRLDEITEFDTELVSCRFEEGAWRLETQKEQVLHADVVIAATGVLHHPKQIQLPGAETFCGKSMHSARWDTNIETANLNVGVIGNGSTGVQLVSHLSGKTKSLSHFQRTPQWIMPVENPHFTEEQKQQFRQDEALLKRMQTDPELEDAINRFSQAIVDPESNAMAEIEAYVLANLENNVTDPVLRQQLTPMDRAACKRLIYSPDYYQAIQRDGCKLITSKITSIQPTGIQTEDGQLHNLDLIVYATGFHADRFIRPAKIYGRDGVMLDDVWSSHPTAYLSVAVPKFPNLFFLNGPNGPVGNFSLIEIAESQMSYIEQLINEIALGETRHIEVKQAAMDVFDEERIKAAKTTIFGSGCDSWYLDATGVPATWPWTRAEFHRQMEAPNLDHFDFS